MIVLTFDTDWMSTEAMGTFFELYPELPKSTFFLHQFTREWSFPNHETNPHPTMDFDGQSDLAQIEGRLGSRRIGIRSHSCFSSHTSSVNWANLGYQYQSNEVHLGDGTIKPRPLPWGLFEIPIFYMDNMERWAKSNKLSKFFNNVDYLSIANNTDSPLVFHFHPIHIALNTSNNEEYGYLKSQVIEKQVNPWALTATEQGTRDFFENVLTNVLNQQLPHPTLIDLLSTLSGTTRDLFSVK